MKVQTVLLGLVAAVASMPADLGAREMDALTWSGSLYEGGPVVEYTGMSLNDIDDQVQKDYPGLSIYGAVEDSGVDTTSIEDGPAALAERELSKRTVDCITRFGWGDGFQMNSLWRQLKGVGGRCYVNARRCALFGCYKTAGAATCNDNHHQLVIDCKVVGEWVEQLATRDCIWPTANCGGRGKVPSHVCATGIAGQKFSAHKTWNVIAGDCGAFNPNGWNVGSNW